MEKNKFSQVPNLKQLYLEIFKYHAEKKNVSIIFEVKSQKKYFVEKKILTVNLSWNDPYVFTHLKYSEYSHPYSKTKIYKGQWPYKDPRFGFWGKRHTFSYLGPVRMTRNAELH